MVFEPIAVVGRSCLLPGANHPAALWQAVRDGRDLIGRTPAGYWRVAPELVMTDRIDAADDRTWTDRGGYVTGFEALFDPTGFALEAERVMSLDPLVQWVLHCAREALRDAGHDGLAGAADARLGARSGIVLGNLSYPTQSLSRFAESVWLEAQGADFAGGQAAALAGVRPPDPLNRFMSGLPALLCGRALGLGATAFALDAACASSLYAIKLACDELQAGRADLMLAGGVNRADDLFIHVGFCALRAMSQTGRSRPFHRHADGLVPAEGAALVVLKRLADAVAAGDPIRGVIRTIGLSNDGRGRGLLVPSQEGQERCLRRAYALADGLSPHDVSLVECHATGTPVGDEVEVRSMQTLFGDARDVPIGSLKSNLGHLVTVSGAAGLLKVLAAMDAGIRPPTLHADPPLEGLQGGPLRVLHAAEPWETGGEPRRGAVNNFGFGGNNAHLVVEQWTGEDHRRSVAVPTPRDAAPPAVAIVGVEALVGDGAGVADLTADLFAGQPRRRAQADGTEAASAAAVDLPLAGIRFPPADLDQTLAQQLFLLRALWQLLQDREVAGQPSLPRETTGVLVGMQCDAEVARYGARWRIPEWAARWAEALGAEVDDGWLGEARERIGALRQAAGVVGAMPNIPANRLCSQFDLAGPSFTLSAEELSGPVALDLAVQALQQGELDAAVVAAVDLGCEPVHAAAARAVLRGDRQVPGDAAVVLLLKRLDEAIADGEPIWGLVEPTSGAPDYRLEDPEDRLGALFGHAHAAAGLLRVAAAAVACRHRGLPLAVTERGAKAVPWLPNPGGGHERLAVEVSTTALLGPTHRCRVRQGPGPVTPVVADGAVPRITCFEAADLAGLRQAAAADRSVAVASSAPCRLVVVAPPDQRAARVAEAQQLLGSGASPAGPVDELAPGIYLSEAPLAGELAAVFTGPAGAYPGMGREQALAFPELVTALGRSCCRLGEAAAWIYAPGGQDAESELTPHDKLWGSSFLSQLHLQLCRQVLGLEPEAAVGFCSGESNALFAFGAWRDMDAMFDELVEAGVFTEQLGGRFAAIEREWRTRGLVGEHESVAWQNWRLLVDEQQVAAAVADQPLVRLTIINAPGDVVIGGQAEACEAVVSALGRHRAYRLGYDVAIHCPEVAGYRDTWRRIHHRKTHPVANLRFYSCFRGESYQPTADSAADAFVGLALNRVDFPRLVRRAWDDGVRIFVELGPRDGCTKWIGRALAGKEHLAVALDGTGRSSLHQLVDAAGRLLAAGLAVDHSGLNAAIDGATVPRAKAPEAGTKLRRYPAHPETVGLPPLAGSSRPSEGTGDDGAQWMEPAPYLPPVLPGEGAPAAVAAAKPAVANAGGVRDAAADGVGPASPARGAMPAPVRQAMAHHERVVALHQQFLVQQAAVHQQFVAQRQRSLAELAARAGAGLGQQPSRGDTTAPRAAEPAPARDRAAPGVQAVTRGPTFDRRQLEVLASGSIASVFGPAFAAQDPYPRQVRLPEPPLLLVDRVTGIDGEPASMGTGTIWTETDVTGDAWYLDDGVMPAGIMVESGQADLLLISWLGVDLVNRGERAYRLLGCDLTYAGRLPRVGDTLCYDIHVDGHASAGPVRLFFFHYDCRINGEVCLSVRNGQAGFFTDQELDDSGGILWDPHSADCRPTEPARVDPPRVDCKRRQLSAAQVQAFAEGRVRECFGPGFELAETHTRTPKIQAGRLQLIDEVTELAPQGGPWGRGYLRVENQVSPDDWYLAGHFKNDPCMPGTLMCEGCLQAMALYLTAMGYTLDKDGWRFEPVGGETYNLRCRGQVTPSSRHLVYEVFVEELWDGPEPTIIADILGTADGLKIFHGRRMGLRLVPEWPLTSRPELLAAIDESPHPAATVDGFTFGYASLLACAWGRPSDAFGPTAAVFDGTRHIARLPGPPYHFMSRVTRVDGQLGSMKTGASIELDYDIPPDAWYFDENGRRCMPFCVLLEAALQPCGWLAVYIGGPGTTEQDLYFRNLDGTSTQRAILQPDSGTLRTRTTLTSISRVAGVVLVSYRAECLVGDEVVYEIDTGFGFFGKEALAQQVGLPATDEERAWLDEPNDFALELTSRPPRYCDGPLRLPGPMLLMIDRVTGYWPTGGPAGLGRWRAEKTVNVSEWFFKAHFYRDPVQPGSLGLEAMIQLLQLHLLHTEAAGDLENPQFEPLELGRPLTWKYRGQVTPTDRRITVELNVLEQGWDEEGVAYHAVAEAWLWVDQLRIYHARNLGMRVVAGKAPSPTVARRTFEEVLDPAVETWIGDHRPNYTLATLPLMSILDRLAGAALAFVTDQYRWTPTAEGASSPPRDWVVEAVEDVALKGWLTFVGPRRLRCDVTPVAVTAAGTHVSAVTLAVTLAVWRDAASVELSRFEPVATGRVRVARGHGSPPEPWHPPADATFEPDPYETGALFHGAAFQLLRSLQIGAAGSSAELAADGGGVPHGTLNQALLDGLVHGIPHDDLRRWSAQVDAEDLAYPFRVRRARFYEPSPSSGSVRCEARFAGFAGGERFPLFRIQGIVDGRVWAAIDLVEVLVPMGEHGRDRTKRVTFLRDRHFLPGIGISTFAGDRTELAFREVAIKDWLQGSVAHAYAVAPGTVEAVARLAAIKDHVAQRAGAHPSTVTVSASDSGSPSASASGSAAASASASGSAAASGSGAASASGSATASGSASKSAAETARVTAVASRLPLTRFPVEVRLDDDGVAVTDGGPPRLDLTPIAAAGRRRIGIDGWVGESVSLALCHRFVRQVVVTDPAAFAAQRGKPTLFLGNHQVQIESVLLPILAGGLTERHVVTIAGSEHQTGWVGAYGQFSCRYPEGEHPPAIIFFDQQDRQSMFTILEQLRQEVAAGHSVFVHVEGQLGRACRRPVERLSSVFIDLALELGLAVVPVRFLGGLPVEPLAAGIDFPVGYGKQDYYFGRPIEAAELAPLPYARRRSHILDALNRLGPSWSDETPSPPDPAFGERVRHWLDQTAGHEAKAVIATALEDGAEQLRDDISAVLDPAADLGTDAKGRWLAELSRWLFDR